MRKKANMLRRTGADDVVFRPALEPLEASVLPAKEPRRYILLPMIWRACDAAERLENQRAKIWVR